MSLLEIRNLAVARGAGIVLHNLSLDLAQGEILAVLGPNGAGKTTLLETVVGLHRPKGGSIRLDGEEIGGERPQKIAARGLRLVPEGRRLFSRLTVAENLRTGAEGAGRDDWDWVLEIFPPLRNRLDNLGGALSGGEQQMVAIARALVARPRLVFLDEPSWGLAPLLVEGVLKVIGEIREMGTTIVLVEQNVDAALKVADRACVLSGGEILREFTRAEALADPDQIHDLYFSRDRAGQGAA